VESQVKYVRLHDGTLIDPITGRSVVPTEINKVFSDEPQSSALHSGRKGAAISGVSRRYIDDLPTTPPQSRAVAIVAAYSLFGLHEIDISRILNTSISDVQAIIASDPYDKFMDAMLQNIREHDRDAVRKQLNKAAKNAVKKVVELVESPDEKVALSASKDVLDRVSKQDNQQHMNTSGLTIRVIDDRESSANIEVSIDG
jgi:hypothetical protein